MRGNKLRKKGITIVVSLCILFITLTSCSSIKVPPAGVDFESEEYHSEIAEFNYDLSYLTKDGDVAYDTNIFKNVYKQKKSSLLPDQTSVSTPLVLTN